MAWSERGGSALRCLAWSVGMAVAVSTGGDALAVPDKRPNIVLLVADDWGFSDLGSFGGEIATPHLDALALSGTRFANFHVSASCSPTRAMLLTGVDNHRNGVGNLRETMPRAHLGQPGYLGSLSANVVTVSSLLKDSGYRTYVAGKWNVGSEPHNLPNQRGFDRSLVQGDTGSDNWEPDKRYLPHAAKVYWFEDGKEAVMPKTYYSSEYFVDKTIGYIQSGAQSGQPFFAYVGFQANHVPVQAPQAFVDNYKGRYAQGWTALRQQRRDRAAVQGVVPPNVPMVTLSTTANWDSLTDKEQAYQARRMEVYAAMAEAMDHHVGRLVSHLKQTGQFDNTVFVFLSDNGAEGADYADARLWLATQYTQDMDRLGGQGAYVFTGPSWASASVSPLNTYKFYAGEGGLRVPMVIAGVKGDQPRRIVQSLTHVTDIVPTLLDVAGVSHPGSHYRGQFVEAMAGRSLLPVIRGETDAVRGPQDTLGHELSGNQALFKGDLKLVKNLPPVGDGLWHLYDIRKDPGETQDLQQQMPDVFQSMQQDYAAYAKAHGVLAMPEGYDPMRQVVINSILNYWYPTYWRHVSGVVLTMVLATVWYVARRRARRKVTAPISPSTSPPTSPPTSPSP